MTPCHYPPPPPIDSLPRYLGDLVASISTRLKVDPGMALAALEAGMASAAHGTAFVVHPEGGPEPLSLFGVVIAGPTTGKTRTYRMTHRVHLEEDRLRHANSLSVAQPQKQTAVPTLHRTNHRIRWVALQNSTNRGVVEALEGVGESTSVSSDEGQNVLSSDLFKRHLDTCNSLWDGNKVMLNRARGHSAVATDASLVVFLMTQPDMFETYRRKHGELARGIGFFARTLFTIADPAQPLLANEVGSDDGAVAHYEGRVQELLSRQRSRTGGGSNERQAIKFTSEACAMFASLEQQHIRAIPYLYTHMEDAANRALQNTVRLAAILHLFSGESGDIPPATLLAAYSLVQWHLAHFSGLFDTVHSPHPLSPPQRAVQRAMRRDAEDREAILSIISELSRVRQSPIVLRSEVQTLFRAHAYDARFRAALLRLKNEGMVIELPGGKATGLMMVPPGGWCAAPLIWTPDHGYL